MEQTLKQLFEHYHPQAPTRARVVAVSGKGYWCSAKPCFPDGADKPEEPIIQRIPIDPVLQGHNRGFCALPQVGQLVRIGFYGGDPSDPFLDAPLAQGIQTAKADLDEITLQHSKRSFWKIFKDGVWEWLAPKITARIGSQYTLTVDAKSKTVHFQDNAGTSLELQSKNATLQIQIAANEQITVNGASMRNYQSRAWVVQGKDERLVTGLGEYTFLQGLNILLAQGGLLQSPLQTKLGMDKSGLLLVAQTAAGGSLGEWLANLCTQLDALISAINHLSVPTGTGPSGTPINQAQFLQVKARLTALKAQLNLILQA